MSKRSHHRGANPININELAEALTRNGWQPPHQNQHMNHFGSNPMPGMNPSGAANGGAPPLANNLSALSGLLGAVNSGGMPGMGQQPPNGITPPPAGGMPQMPMGGGMPPLAMGGMPQMPMSPMAASPMQMQQAANAKTTAQPVNDTELLKKLFQEIIKLLKET